MPSEALPESRYVDAVIRIIKRFRNLGYAVKYTVETEAEHASIQVTLKKSDHRFVYQALYAYRVVSSVHPSYSKSTKLSAILIDRSRFDACGG